MEAAKPETPELVISQLIRLINRLELNQCYAALMWATIYTRYERHQDETTYVLSPVHAREHTSHIMTMKSNYAKVQHNS